MASNGNGSSHDARAPASPVAIGQTLSHYSILERLGAGGMGEVYRARDTTLDRDVAIKVLPEGFAARPERRARFAREARLLGSLNHPNIGAIYGLEEADGVRFLVLELVEGETLAEQLRRGRPRVKRALEICRQIAEALEAAHSQGVIHRDLKPGNVMVTPERRVKVVDFGIAKSLRAGEARARTAAASDELTVTGRQLGTAPYMSPEQVRGRAVDERTDVWAFGCVLYEALTGRPAFQGETPGDVLAAILEREPDWSALPAATPVLIVSLLRRCLEKDLRHRLHAIADARIEIAEATRDLTTDTTAAAPTPPVRALWRRRLVWLTALAAAAGAALLLWRLFVAAPPAPPARLVIALPPAEGLVWGSSSPIAISPDGRRVVYAASRDGQRQLFVRALDRFDAEPIPGTKGAYAPFFSADGEWVGFVSDRELRKVALGGGPPETITKPAGLWSAVWGSDDTIVFAAGADGLWRVPAAGGAAERLTTPDPAGGEMRHGAPRFLPGRAGLLFGVVTLEGSRTAVLDLTTGRHRLIEALGVATGAHYLDTGQLVYAQEGELMTVPFDLERLEVRGPAVPLGDRVATAPWQAIAHFDVSRSGQLAYLPEGSYASRHTLAWVDREGRTTALGEGRDLLYGTPRLSPDGKRLAVTAGPEGADVDVWLHDLVRGTWGRLTFEGSNQSPVWTPDGARIAFASNRSGPLDLYWVAADGGEEPVPLLVRDRWQHPHAWSPDGTILAFLDSGDVWLLPVAEGGEAVPLLDGPFSEDGLTFSPDGRRIAYVSDETGRPEVYVRSYPDLGAKQTISTDGGVQPRWSRDGSELFYRVGDRMMAVTFGPEPGRRAAPPQLLFQGAFARAGRWLANYDVAPDGDRFLMIRSERGAVPDRIHVVLDWRHTAGRRP